MIVGTLYSNSRVIYGCTASGVPMFRFQSQEGEFRVSCRKRSATPMRALIKRLTDSRAERAELVEILGPVGNPDVEYLTILLHRQLPRNSLKLTPKSAPIAGTDRLYEDQTHLEVVTVDPANCLDAD